MSENNENLLAVASWVMLNSPDLLHFSLSLPWYQICLCLGSHHQGCATWSWWSSGLWSSTSPAPVLSRDWIQGCECWCLVVTPCRLLNPVCLESPWNSAAGKRFRLDTVAPPCGCQENFFRSRRRSSDVFSKYRPSQTISRCTWPPDETSWTWWSNESRGTPRSGSTRSWRSLHRSPLATKCDTGCVDPRRAVPFGTRCSGCCARCAGWSGIPVPLNHTRNISDLSWSNQDATGCSIAPSYVGHKLKWPRVSPRDRWADFRWPGNMNAHRNPDSPVCRPTILKTRQKVRLTRHQS